jgi:hypothetical protein
MRNPAVCFVSISVMGLSAVAADPPQAPPGSRPRSVVPAPSAPVPVPVRPSPIVQVAAQTKESPKVRVPHPEEIQDKLKLLSEEFAAAGLLEEARAMASLEKRVAGPLREKLLAAYLKTLDQQISLNFRIIEVSPNADITPLFPDRTKADAPQTLSGIYDRSVVDKWVKEAERRSELKVCVQEQLTILNGRTARLVSGTDGLAVPTVIGAEDQAKDQPALPGSGLVVKGTVTRDNLIELGIVVDYWQSKGENSRFQTEVELQSGQSMVLHGMLGSRSQVEVSRVPILGDVPVVGRAFSSRKTTQVPVNLMLVVTPEIVQPIVDRPPTIRGFETR